MPSSTDKHTQTANNSTATSQSSYAPQVADLNQAFTDAMSAYGKSSSATAPTNFTAAFSPEELQAFRGMVGYGGDSTLPNNQATNGTTLADAGAAGTTGALSGYSSFDPTASNNAGSLIDSANKFVAGQDIPSQVKLAMQGATETARDVTMPGIEQNAAITGNTNSSRTGIADGLVQRGLAEQSANLGGALRSQAFQNGLTLAQQQAQNNNTSKLQALAGEGAVGNAASSTGNTAQNSSVANMIQKLSAAATGGAGLTAGDQAALDNQLKQFESQSSSPYLPLQQLLGIIGGNYGQTTTASGTGTSDEHSTTTASPLSVAGGILGAGTSLMGSGGLNLLAPAGQGILSWMKGM
jgi:hypothetical protein